jgi:hypothetical protein
VIQDVVAAVHELLDAAEIRHAFGGALALVQYAEPRGTIDIDVNVSTAPADAETVVRQFARIDYHPTDDPDRWLPMAGVRFANEANPVVIDVFFSFDDYLHDVLGRAQLFPFLANGTTLRLPFLAADDLVVFKLSFNRPKDWVDIDAMIRAGTPIQIEAVAERLLRFR